MSQKHLCYPQKGLYRWWEYFLKESEESRTELTVPSSTHTQHWRHSNGGENIPSLPTQCQWSVLLQNANMQKRNLKSPILMEKSNCIRDSILPHSHHIIHVNITFWCLVLFCLPLLGPKKPMYWEQLQKKKPLELADTFMENPMLPIHCLKKSKTHF